MKKLFPLTHPKIRRARFVDLICVEMNKYIKPILPAENIANWVVFCIINLTDRLHVFCVVNAPLEKGPV
jgi:hypothetical protein